MTDVVAEKKVVTMEYVLRDAKGTELDKSDPEAPMAFLAGARNIVPGLEKQLVGKAVGDEVKAVVPPAEGYGEKMKMKPIRMPRSRFPKDAQIRKGMQFMTQTEQGMMPLWVTKVQGPTVVVSPQHPLAGVELHFDVKILEIRDATDEELEHGHVHGPGGHDHGADADDAETDADD